MSRIHEALKKAEQERVLGHPPGGAMDAAPGTPVLEADVMPTAVTDTAPAMEDSPPTLQLLTERCARTAWTPDPERLLFQASQNHNHVVGSEEFRTLRTRLYQIRQKQQLQTLLVSSALPGEGKTFVAANLAQVIVRQRGRRVLLIDTDLRRSQLHLMLGAPAAPGLTEYLRGDADEYAVIQRGPAENLFFTASGNHVTNPTELLANGRLGKFLQRLAPVFDWIVLDSPPAVLVSDASMIADLCDGVLLVLRSAVTPLDMAQKARQEFHNKGLLGVVLNRVEPRDAYKPYYYYYGRPGKENQNGDKDRG
jgi:protein-tyrosine kinase